MEKETLEKFGFASATLLTAYIAYIDSGEDSRKRIPSLLMVALSGYLAIQQFRSARQEVLIASTQQKLGTINLNQKIS